jgi:hypothetical protein
MLPATDTAAAQAEDLGRPECKSALDVDGDIRGLNNAAREHSEHVDVRSRGSRVADLAPRATEDPAPSGISSLFPPQERPIDCRTSQFGGLSHLDRVCNSKFSVLVGERAISWLPRVDEIDLLLSPVDPELLQFCGLFFSLARNGGGVCAGDPLWLV